MMHIPYLVKYKLLEKSFYAYIKIMVSIKRLLIQEHVDADCYFNNVKYNYHNNIKIVLHAIKDNYLKIIRM